jgi:hypothetical protein
MRKIVFATLIAAGLGLAGATTASAAPVNGTVIHDSATIINDSAKEGAPVVKVQHWWRRSRGWRRSRCHYRRWSRWGWC